MEKYQLKSPVLFLIFKRPDTTKLVFEAIRKAKPPRLYVAADGPRDSRPGEDAKVKAVHDYVLDHIDWDCDVKTLFRDKNLGCKYAVSSAIDWFFENEEIGIILEDDCLPHASFFRFCEELLQRYRDDERIWIISGDNFQFGKRRTSDSYYFSRYSHIWGWASWRRTWRKYDVGMKHWPSVKNQGRLSDILQDRKLTRYWHDVFEAVFNNKIDTWDYQLNFACWINNALSIMPNINLISNIGFGADATRTAKINQFSKIPVSEMKFPLVHPTIVIRDVLSDAKSEHDQFIRPAIISRIRKTIRRIIS